MAMPKKRMSHHRSGTRRAHLALAPKTLRPCSNCRTQTLPHRVCPNCGYYGGRQVLKRIANSE